MRVAIVTQSFYPRMGGLSEHAANVGRELMRRGHDVTIVTGNSSGFKDQASDFRCVRLGRNVGVPVLGGISDIALGRGLREELAELLGPRNFDVAHVHSPLVPTLPLFAAELSRVPVVGQFHSYARSHAGLRLFHARLLPAYRRLAARLAVSPAAREFLGRYFDVEDVRIVPGGVDTARFRPDAPPYARLRDDKLNLLTVGRLEPRKGVHVLLDALRRLRLGERARLIVVGDGPLRHALMTQARFARLEVLFMNYVSSDQLPRVYASADLFCAPATENESFGVVLLEAMAAGLPVLATALPGYAYVVRHGVDGVLVKKPAPEAWTEALQWLLEDADAREKFKLRARARAQEFAWPGIVDRLEAEYRRAVGGFAPAEIVPALAPRAGRSGH